MDLVGYVQAAGGFARTRELLAAGATERMLTAAVRDGRLRRARNGWYSTLPEYDPRFRAVRVGGKLTGLSALRALGAWTRGGSRILRVSVPAHGSRLRSPAVGRRRPRRRGDPVRISWDPPEVARSGDIASVDPLHALVRVVLDEPLEEAIVALDWAWRAGLLDEPSFAWLIEQLPRPLHRIREWVDRRSESPNETLARVRARGEGWSVATQVRLGDVQRIDLTVEQQIGWEVDGRQHADSFHTDRLKDLRIAVEGRHPLRTDAELVGEDWPLVRAAIRASLAARIGWPELRRREAAGRAALRRPRRRGRRWHRGRPRIRSPLPVEGIPARLRR
jgi:very-short-patch-repair endonuclease